MKVIVEFMKNKHMIAKPQSRRLRESMLGRGLRTIVICPSMSHRTRRNRCQKEGQKSGKRGRRLETTSGQQQQRSAAAISSSSSSGSDQQQQQQQRSAAAAAAISSSSCDQQQLQQRSVFWELTLLGWKRKEAHHAEAKVLPTILGDQPACHFQRASRMSPSRPKARRRQGHHRKTTTAAITATLPNTVEATEPHGAALGSPESAVLTVSGKYPMDITPGTVRVPTCSDAQAKTGTAYCVAAQRKGGYGGARLYLALPKDATTRAQKELVLKSTC